MFPGVFLRMPDFPQFYTWFRGVRFMAYFGEYAFFCVYSEIFGKSGQIFRIFSSCRLMFSLYSWFSLTFSWNFHFFHVFYRLRRSNLSLISRVFRVFSVSCFFVFFRRVDLTTFTLWICCVFRFFHVFLQICTFFSTFLVFFSIFCL